MKIIVLLSRGITYVLLGIVFFVIVSNIWIYFDTREQVYDNMDEVPDAKVALVLGTSHLLMNGEPNPYFAERMETAAELYKAGKVKHILVSGDNETIYYNEPIKMRKALMELGIPDHDITLDYAGLRTLDSIVRCKKVFGQDNVIIITQHFHGYRALFISNYYNMKAVVMATDEIKESSFKIKMREYLARALAVWDVYIIKKEPKFLGKKESLNV